MADSPLDKAFGGLGGPQSPAGAAPRPWAPPGAAGPIMIDFSKPAGTFKLSILEGGLLGVFVTPPNPEVYIELNKLPTSTMRKGAFGVSFWDLPGIQTVAASLRHEVQMEPPVQDMVDRWTRRCLELEYVKSFAAFPDFHVPGLDIDFLDFQSRGVNYGVMIKNFLLGDQMGCIDGDAVINVNRAGLGRRYRLSDAYRRFHGLDQANWNWDKSIPTFCRALCGDEFRQHRVLDILDKGVRPVVKVSFLSGKVLRLTPDHEVLTKNGWKQAQALRPGEVVVSNGIPKCASCGGSNGVVASKSAKFVGNCRSCISRKLRKMPHLKSGKFIDKDGYVRVSGQWDHHRAGPGGFVYEHILVIEKKLGRKVLRSEHVHHENEVKSDNRPDNLFIKTPSEHNREHRGHRNLSGGRAGNGGEVLFTPKEDAVVSVFPDGETHVYDVVMAAPHHNFVANGIVVHNCGKSIIMLGILFTLRQMLGGRIETMILAPTSVVGDWHKKFQKFAKTEIAVADGSPARRQKAYESKPEFLVLSYDAFGRDAARIIREFRPKAIVPDEAQRITNRKSNTAKKIIDFVDIVQPQFRIPMSGSPINNRADDIWPILHLINPGLAGPAKKFEGRYLKSKPIWKRGDDGKATIMKIEYGSEGKKKSFTPMRLESLDPRKPDEAKILDELRMKIAPHLIRRLKKDVLKDLPPKFHERLDITLGTKERKVYEELQARFAEAMAGVHDEDANGAETTFLSWFTKAQQICSSLEITSDGDESSKIKELKHFVEDHAGDEKIIIFSRFHEMTKIVCRELKAYSPLHLHGGIPQNKRQPLVDAFQEKDEHRLFVSTLKAGGVGLTLTAATIVARLDRWVAPTANEQAEDRAHRIGVKSAVTVVDFVVTDSIEERILEMLDKKLRMIASLISADSADDGEMEERKVVRALFRKRDMLNLI